MFNYYFTCSEMFEQSEADIHFPNVFTYHRIAYLSLMHLDIARLLSNILKKPLILFTLRFKLLRVESLCTVNLDRAGVPLL